MAQRIRYTIEEVNALIPGLQADFVRLLQLRAQLKSTYLTLHKAGDAPSEQEFDIDTGDLAPDVIVKRATLKALVSAAEDATAAVLAHGGIVRNLEPGLVDFRTSTATGDVWLTWRFGESEIGWWHALDEEVTHRKPLSDFPHGG